MRSRTPDDECNILEGKLHKLEAELNSIELARYSLRTEHYLHFVHLSYQM